MKYLVDEALLVESAIEEEINEASGKKEKNYYIQGVFSTPGQKNRNGRIYPMQIWEREVQKYQQVIAENSINTLGEYEHPNRTKVDPLEAVMKIIELKMDNGLVYGKAKILNNNSSKTNQLKALIDEGFKIGVSSRGVGSIKGDVVENFSLLTYDIVSEPSDYNANLSGIMESMQDKNFLITESGEIKEVTEIEKPAEVEEHQQIAESEEIKTELSQEDKKIAAEKIIGKFQDIFGVYNVNEGMKINSKLGVLSALKIIIGKTTDEKNLNILNAIEEFLKKDWSLSEGKITEATDAVDEIKKVVNKNSKIFMTSKNSDIKKSYTEFLGDFKKFENKITVIENK